MRRQTKVERTQYSVQKFLLLAAFASVLISACDSGVSTAPPDVVIDDSRPIGSPVSGAFGEGAERDILRFSVVEDGVLDGLFLTPGQTTLTPSEALATSSGGYTITALPTFGEVTVRSEGRVFHYEPDPDYAGEDNFVYATPAGDDVTASITVTPIPDAPVISRDIDTSANQGRLYSIVLEAVDADGDDLRFSADNLPEWLLLDSRTGVLSGMPQQSDVGLFRGITLTVNDSTGLSDSITDFELEVIDINDPPVLNITQVPREFFGLQSVSFDVFPDDIDGDSVTVSVEPNPLFKSTVDGGRVSLQFEDFNQAQSILLTFVGRDALGAVTREEIEVELYPRSASGKGTTLLGFKEGLGVHIVILGDGYQDDEMRTFRDHVEDVLQNIRSDDGIAGHLGAFNIHMIETVSNQSGADDNDRSDKVDTAFDSAYNCSSIPRLVCADVLKLYEASLSEYPAVDQIILLVNDLRFGGSGNSGGRIAITSAFYPEIALHEMGHSLADLADEYVDPLILETSGQPAFEEGRYKNVSTLSDPALVPWAHWIDPAVALPQFLDDPGVGVFQGGLYRSTGVYRATSDSRMRNYDIPFGPVNTEQWILRLYTLTEGIRELKPRVQVMQSVALEPQEFSVEPIFGFDVQQISWSLNGEPLLASGELLDTTFDNTPAGLNSELTVVLENAVGGVAFEGFTNDTFSKLVLLLPPGEHQLTVTVSDTSDKIRVSPPHVGIFSWTWSITSL